MDCNCPVSDILVEIPQSDCPFDLGQVQKFAFGTSGKVIWDSATGGGAGADGGTGGGAPATQTKENVEM